MELRRTAPVGGAIACLLTAVVLVVPYFLIQGHDQLVIDYYAAGPVGAGGVGFLAVLGAVIFLAGEKGNADPETIAGVTAVLGLALVGFATLWLVSVGDVVYHFPPAYHWIEHHALVVLSCSVLVLVAGVGYAKAILDL